MSTPRRDSPERTRSPMASSPMTITMPARNGSESPVRLRRTESPGDEPSHLRLSPTLARGLNPNGPESRERQRTLDADMAAHLSRARQNSVTSPAGMASPFHPLPTAHPTLEHPSLTANQMPSFSEGEEREFEAARAGGPGSAPPTVEIGEDVDVDAKSEFPFSTAGDGLDNRMDEPRDVDMMYASAATISTPQGHRPQVPIAGQEPFLPPMYQPAYGASFDWGHMEEYAGEEKRRLGLDTPGSPPNALQWLDANTPAARRVNGNVGASTSRAALDTDGAETASIAGTDNGDGPGPSRIRHRKLSQSAHVPRAARGPGKKTALFEGAAGAPPPSLVPGGAPPDASAMSSFENIFGVRTGAPAPGGGHDRPYRFSFYSNALSATIHARSLAELPADGQSFEQLFQGVHPGADADAAGTAPPSAHQTQYGSPAPSTMHALAARRASAATRPGGFVMPDAPAAHKGAVSAGAPLDGNTWWLDVLNPTDEEMKMLSKVFGIHPLTTEDILMEETREKIELFRNYYLVCFRGFDQDPYSPTHLEPLNMYIIVFREGTLSFHFRSTPHPQNVRRRIKQLKDYISVTSDWISYALIDDITDAFGPLIQGIEYEVDSIDELVLILKEAEQSDMLRRIGTCRKKVMGLLRLVGNKADVVKGLAKRCNENWRVAPTSDIGLYLSDIQDHLITMTQNLNHYEKILSRSHSNYLAQISIEMTEANNQINDVLSKMTALGTVLIPMNLITGLWGMNVHVPGQDIETGYTWFLGILGCLIVFAVAGGWVTFRLMSTR